MESLQDARSCSIDRPILPKIHLEPVQPCAPPSYRTESVAFPLALRGDLLLRLNSLSRFSALALTLTAIFAFAGCGKNPFTPPPDDGESGLPENTVPADSPQNLMARFQATYEYQVQPEYVKLLTNDFRYTFSADTDPTLVAQYGPNWGK